MRIVKPSAKLEGLSFAVDHDGRITGDAAKIIELAARTAYKSEGLITADSADKLIRKLLNQRPPHTAITDHAGATIRIVCDRGISHELVRTRIGVGYLQESTRFCGYWKEKFNGQIAVIEPPGLEGWARSVWYDACEWDEEAYLALTRNGVPAQIARSVLPTCLKTEVETTMSFTAWCHFLELRLSKRAHPQMCEVAGMIRDILVSVCPVVFERFLPERYREYEDQEDKIARLEAEVASLRASLENVDAVNLSPKENQA